MAVLIAWYLAKLFWLFFPAQQAPTWSVPERTSSSAGASSPTIDVAAIINAHLFGEDSGEAPPPVETEDAPETRLNLELRGAIAADDRRMAHAIIADGGGKEQVYFLGDPVPGGATLHRVQIDRVILNRGGALETLKLPREFASIASAQSPARAPTRTPRRQQSVQQVVTQNVSTFTEIIRPQPYMPNGQLKGYRIYPGRNRQQFAALGLRPGDLVTEINGMTLNNPAQGMEIFRSLGDTTQVTVTIERSGQPQVLTLDTTQLDQLSGAKR
jgi:general secretion pathway protein C